jgi:acyl-CoA thioesterase-1
VRARVALSMREPETTGAYESPAMLAFILRADCGRSHWCIGWAIAPTSATAGFPRDPPADWRSLASPLSLVVPANLALVLASGCLMKIIALGDSIAYGQNVRACEAWPAVLERLTGHDVRNEGVCGETTRLGLERFPKAVQLHKPDVVVIQYGHNDCQIWETDNGLPRVSAQAYAANIIEMAERSAAAGARTLIIWPHQAPGKDAAYNGRLIAYRQEVGIMGSLIVRTPSPVTVLDDGYGLHPDAAMHRRYAENVAAAL